MTNERLHAHVTAQTVALLAGADAEKLLRTFRREMRSGRFEPTRRGFLQAMAAASAGFAVDPERLVWSPGQVSIHDMALPSALAASLRRAVDYLAEQFAQAAGQFFVGDGRQEHVTGARKTLTDVWDGEETPDRLTHHARSLSYALRGHRLERRSVEEVMASTDFGAGLDVAYAKDPVSGVVVRVTQYDQPHAGRLTDFEVLTEPLLQRASRRERRCVARTRRG